jgi:formate dehydrogenase subunit beta
MDQSIKKMQSELRKTVVSLFSDNKLDVLIGHTEGTLPFRSRPCFVYGADEAQELVWNRYCSNNLAVYLPGLFKVSPRQREQKPPPRVGIVAKGCEIRSIMNLAQENQIVLDNVTIIGMPCQGMLVASKAERNREANEEDLLVEACVECAIPIAEGADIVIEGEARQPYTGSVSRVKAFSARPAEERWRYFEKELAKCIKCYACRQACPNCYCPVCFAEQAKPRWTAPGNDSADIMLYHIGRIFHQAGRCVNCDACVQACPVGIDLRTLTQKVTEDVMELFDYGPRESLKGTVSPLRVFREDDTEDFTTKI